jgi:glycosyltransferase A (GT-A) superfamily protein (DUF2064 family)
MLKLEPREAALLPVPSADLLRAARSDLQEIRPLLGPAIRAGDWLAAAKRVDDVLLRKHLGLSRASVRELEDAHRRLADRRRARGRKIDGER